MSLFEADVRNPDQGYSNLRNPSHPIDVEIRTALEAMWERYQPFADNNFAQAFARDLAARFWEMYLTLQLLDEGKNVIPRSDLPSENRRAGPDICIIENGRTVWIEAITPDAGERTNLDRVPEPVLISNGTGAQLSPRRQVELRITGALLQKRDAFQRYSNQGLVSENDICVIAVSGTRFFAQSATMGLPLAVSAVYPFGNQYVTFSRETFDVIETGFHHSEHIHRANGSPIPRYSFLDQHFNRIAGLLWSRRGIGNFLQGPHDFTFVHNVTVVPGRALPTRWMHWREEDVVTEREDGYELTRDYPAL